MVMPETQNNPLARTYHASCLLDKFMIVSGGEAQILADLQDLWAFNLETREWRELKFTERFHAKRFHTASAISGNRVVTFGGCHSEYVHLNEVNIFDLTNFVSKGDVNISCIKVDCKVGPSSRWGHTANVFKDKVYVHGGRNDADVGDLWVFDADNQSLKWSQVPLQQPIPKPRRRGSAVFISSSLVLFGGFDGEFYNDLHTLHLTEP
jgi:hypothetical protein